MLPTIGAVMRRARLGAITARRVHTANFFSSAMPLSAAARRAIAECDHKVCIGCMGELIASNPTFESQQPHNRGKVLPAPWAGMCPMRCATFSQREMRRQLRSS